MTEAPAIITALPKYHDGEINRALEREIRTGMQLKIETERARELEAAQQAKEAREAGGNGPLGKLVAVMPNWDYFRLVQKYGHKEVHSKEFLKYFQRKMPELAVGRV